MILSFFGKTEQTPKSGQLGVALRHVELGATLRHIETTRRTFGLSVLMQTTT